MYAISKVNLKIRSQLFSTLVKQEIGFFDSSKTGIAYLEILLQFFHDIPLKGDITSRLTSDCQVMSDTVATNVNLFLRCLIMLVGSILMMISLSWRMTMLIFIILPVIAIISKVYGKYYDVSWSLDALLKN